MGPRAPGAGTGQAAVVATHRAEWIDIPYFHRNKLALDAR